LLAGLGALLRCDSLVWRATPRSSRLASHPNPTAKSSSNFFTNPKGSFVNNLDFLLAGLGALLRCDSLVWRATPRSSRLASHPNPTAKSSSNFFTNSKLHKSMLVLALVSATTGAFAQGYGAQGDRAYDNRNSVSYDFARVVDVQPVYDDVRVPEPREVCWNEPVTYAEPRYTQYRPRSGTQEVVGGIIGGLIGNQFGHGDGRAAATIAGVALGASVARDSERRGYYDGYAPRYQRTVNERRCEVRNDHRRERVLVGYDVTYDYKGTVGHTFSERQPGTEIRVRVDVQAAD